MVEETPPADKAPIDEVLDALQEALEAKSRFAVFQGDELWVLRDLEYQTDYPFKTREGAIAGIPRRAQGEELIGSPVISATYGYPKNPEYFDNPSIDD